MDYSEGAAWMAGEIVPVSQAKISVLDWGLTHSDITYDVVHAWDGRFFRIDDYLARFERSIEKCQLSLPQSRDEMRQILHDLVARSGLRRSYVSMVASRGLPGVAGSRDPRHCINHFYAWCVPFVWVFLEEVVARGAHIYVPDDLQRISQNAVDPTAKNYHWGDFTQGLLKAKSTGFDNTVLLDAEGNVTEGPGFNVFIIKDGKVRTPREGVLEGITRRTAMEIAAHHNLPCEAGEISFEELLEADEVFATTTGGGLVPITRINERVFGNGSPGELTIAMGKTYWDWHNDPAMSMEIKYAD